MHLIDYDRDSFSRDLASQCSLPTQTPTRTLFTSDMNGLRAFWGSIREFRQEVMDSEFLGRLGHTPHSIATWRESLKEIYDAAKRGRNSSDLTEGTEPEWRHIRLAPVLASASRAIPKGTLLLEADPQELEAYARMLEVTLEEIEDWEYDLRMGFTPLEIEEFVAQIRSLIACP